MKRKRVYQFIGKMNSIENGERAEIVDPFHFPFNVFQLLLLKLPQGWKGLDDPIFNCLEDFAPQRSENIQGELPVVRPLLNQGKACRFAKSRPHFSKLTCEDSSEDRADADIREKVSVFANPGACGSIIASQGIIEGELHEAHE